MKKQTGFTLIELAIVLVIIGLLLGGVLKGQELINSAKVKNLATDFKNVQVFIYGYQDKFKSLPGDDAAYTTHLAGNVTPDAPASGTLGNGVIEGDYNATTKTESCLFWQQIRLAGLAPGSTTVDCSLGSDYWPKNADGGQIGMQSISGFTAITSNAAGGANSGMSGAYVVCSAGILGKFAKQLDTTLDDGNTDTGSLRAKDPNATKSIDLNSTANADSTPYTVCMAF